MPARGPFLLCLARSGSAVANITCMARHPIFEAAHQDNVDSLTELLDAEPELVDSRTDDFQRTPLHCASKRGSRAAARLLLARGADPQARDSEGNTPLELAQDPETQALFRLAGVGRVPQPGHTRDELGPGT